MAFHKVFAIFIICFCALLIFGAPLTQAEPTKFEISTAADTAPFLDGIVPVEGEGYRINAGDEIRIIIFEEKELSGNLKVNDVGAIAMPLLGDVKVEGLTSGQIAALIAHKLEDGFLRNAKVTVSVVSKQPFYILGEVRDPGDYDYNRSMTVLSAVAMAGGFTYRARKNEVEIMRRFGNETIVIKEVPVEEEIIPGDIIVVKERFF